MEEVEEREGRRRDSWKDKNGVTTNDRRACRGNSGEKKSLMIKQKFWKRVCSIKMYVRCMKIVHFCLLK